MRCFTNEDAAFYEQKINYVDKNNVLLGFDMAQSCCESFGHGVFMQIPETKEAETAKIDIAPYCFTGQRFDCLPSNDDGGGGLAFLISADGLPDAYVVIWNHHNGYYSHGFDFNGESGGL